MNEHRETTRLATHSPSNVADVVALLHLHRGEAAICMGGTDLVPRLRTQTPPRRHVICCSRIAELRGVANSDGWVEVGAGVTYRELAQNATVLALAPTVAALARHIANPRVRNRGTLGGVLCAARDRSDPPTLLAAMRAQAVLVSSSGQRTVPVDQLITGRRTTTLAADELLTHIRIPTEDAAIARFDRVGSTQGPLVNVAMTNSDGITRLAIGGMSPKPHTTDFAAAPGVVELCDAARVLAEQSWSAETAMVSRWYGGEVAVRLMRRLLATPPGAPQ